MYKKINTKLPQNKVVIIALIIMSIMVGANEKSHQYKIEEHYILSQSTTECCIEGILSDENADTIKFMGSHRHPPRIIFKGLLNSKNLSLLEYEEDYMRYRKPYTYRYISHLVTGKQNKNYLLQLSKDSCLNEKLHLIPYGNLGDSSLSSICLIPRDQCHDFCWNYHSTFMHDFDGNGIDSVVTLKYYHEDRNAHLLVYPSPEDYLNKNESFISEIGYSDYLYHRERVINKS